MCLCQRGLNWLSPKLKWVLAIKVRVHERCPLMVRCPKGQSWDHEFWPGRRTAHQVFEFTPGFNNVILILTFSFQKYMRSFICSRVSLYSFLYGYASEVKYWPNMRIVTEWRLYGNEYFAFLFMCSFKNFSAERFLFKVCLPICYFSVSDLSLI